MVNSNGKSFRGIPLGFSSMSFCAGILTILIWDKFNPDTPTVPRLAISLSHNDEQLRADITSLKTTVDAFDAVMETHLEPDDHAGRRIIEAYQSKILGVREHMVERYNKDRPAEKRIE